MAQQRHVGGKAELDELLARGSVKRALLLPPILGGTDDPRNVTWLPPSSIAEKEQFDLEVREEVKRGNTVNYSAVPSYEGDSMVPSRLALRADGPLFTGRMLWKSARS